MSTRTRPSPSSFQVQSIPAVFALKDGKVVDAFIGALPESAISEFVGKLVPQASEADRLVEEGLGQGAEAPLRKALELQPDHAGATTALASMLIARGEADDALSLLARVPETPEVRRLQAEARLSGQPEGAGGADVESRLDGLLDAGPRRPVGAAGVPRPPGDAGARRPADHPLSQGPLRPPVLTAPTATAGTDPH